MIKNILILGLIFLTSISLSGCIFDVKDDYGPPVVKEKGDIKEQENSQIDTPEIKVDIDPEEVI